MLTPGQLSTLALYLYGPQDQAKTKTALALLRATGDRTKTPHHFINLKTSLPWCTTYGLRTSRRTRASRRNRGGPRFGLPSGSCAQANGL